MSQTIEQLTARKNILIGRTDKENDKIIKKIERKIRRLETR